MCKFLVTGFLECIHILPCMSLQRVPSELRGVSSPSEKSFGLGAILWLMVYIFTPYLDTRDVFSPDDEFGEEPSDVENCIRTK